MDRPDEQLMKDYTEGNEEAMSMIFERHKQPILNYALRLLGNRADAEDTVSDVFIVVFQKRYQYQPRVKFKTWLFTVAHNLCIDRIRKRKRFVFFVSKNPQTQELETFELPSPAPSTIEDIQKAETIKYVRLAIAKLPVEQKEALVLREFHNLSYEEISNVLGCSIDKVKVLIYRARTGLRHQLPSFIFEEGQHE